MSEEKTKNEDNNIKRLEDLDLKDRKILLELDKNSRLSVSRLAKMVGLSKEVTNYRVKRLIASGVIKQFHTVFNVGALGYVSYRLLIKFRGASPLLEKEMAEFFMASDIVQAVFRAEGDYDLFVWVACREVNRFARLWEEFFMRYGNNIGGHRLSIFTSVDYYHRDYFVGREREGTGVAFISTGQMQKTDEVDWSIMRLLAADARIPTVEIARRVGLVPKSVVRRIALLEEKGVIAGYRTLFDLEKLGILYYKIHFSLQELAPEVYKRFRTYVRTSPNAIYYNELIGGWDLEFEVQVRSGEELASILADIKSRFGRHIREYHLLRYREELKYLFLPAA